MTGNNAGDFLLGVTYPSMSEIEATYDAIASNPVAAKIYNALDVNLRTIIGFKAQQYKSQQKRRNLQCL